MGKQEILTMLKRQSDYLSGEVISQRLGVSRAAVNKAINGLRQDGYEIESSTRKGYRLLASPDRLTEGEIQPWLHTEHIGKPLLCFSEVDSTSNYLKRESHRLPSGTVAVSNYQTEGRGRMGRVFHSPQDKGIYLSVLLKPTVEPIQALNFTAYLAVAVCEGVERATGLRLDIKWTNDLLLAGKKVCGILTEMAIEGECGTLEYIVPGIGLNVNEVTTDFPENIQKIAGSLAMEVGKPLQRGRVAAEIINSFDQMYWDWLHKKGEYLERYRAACITLGKEVQILRPGREPVVAFAEEIDDDFGLVVRYPDGARETVTSGEVSVRGLLDYA